MSNVIEFPAQTDPHGSGEAFCMQCNHQWVAVAPVGETRFECPECHAHKGMYKYEFVPPKGSLVRECNCGNQLFYIRPEGHMCPNCGIYQSYD
jgi:predicted RNA-binding Zn-ribbon protein involved in translation (DUF1610 family)